MSAQAMDVDSEGSGHEQALQLKEEGNKRFKNRDYMDAIDFYSQAINMDNKPEFYGNRAAAYVVLTKYEEALADCEAALKLSPTYRKAYLSGAKSLQCLGQLEQAKSFANNGLEHYPNDKEIRTLMANIDVLQHKVQMIHEPLWKIEEKFKPPILRSTFSGSNSDEDEVKGVAVLTSDETHDLESCLRMIDALLADDMSQSLNLKNLKTRAFLAKQDYTNALSWSTSLLRWHPKDNTCIKLRALALFKTQNFDSAIKHVQSILRSDPDNKEAKAYFKLFKSTTRLKDQGNFALKNGRLDEAISKYTECLSQDPTNHGFNSLVYANRAAVWLKKKEHQKAFEDCTISIELNDSYAKAYYRRSLALIELERFSEAVSDAEKAYKIDPHMAGIREHVKHCKIEHKKSKRKNYYKILGVEKNADETQLKKAFRKSAMKWHPDRFSTGTEEEKATAEVKFKEIAEAYEVLKDPQMRRKYDAGYDLDEIKQGGGMGGFHGGGMGGMDLSDIMNLLGGMGGGMGGGFGPMGGMGGMGGRGGHGHGHGPQGFTFRFG